MANESVMAILTLGGPRLPLNERTLVMGIINLTPDSFSGDGLDDSLGAAVSRARQMALDGADILDIGAESTRPGSEGVLEADEVARLEPVIRAIRAESDIPLSVDTMKPAVAERCIALGADIINDVNGLRTPGMIEVAAATGVPVIIMHMQGQPRDMQVAPCYGDVVTEVRDFLAERIAAAVAGGVAEGQVAVDPGFGFGKTVAHNLELLRRLGELRVLGRPILAGTSRKSTIGKVLGAAPRTAWQGPSAGTDVPPSERLWGTAATCAIAIANGAAIIRVHDVAAMVQVARMTDAIVGAPDVR
jgi:dihydropteroate synthase